MCDLIDFYAVQMLSPAAKALLYNTTARAKYSIDYIIFHESSASFNVKKGEVESESTYCT